ncbi:Hypothetical_protein [Hexamita inflata]|uniref:Hypothetical_protein n=1 Tax=Hexamita inflata TaxID=28002 RepID=A0AA86PMA3_9EUKA|nr:Hypothetical protein HINF_LOCUS25209 [Hexamita inflata]
MLTLNQQKHVKNMVRQRVLRQNNKKLKKALAKSQRCQAKKDINNIKLQQQLIEKNEELHKNRLEKIELQQKLKQSGLVQSKIIINLKEQNIIKYYEYDRKVAVLKYIRLGIRGYITEKMSYKENLNIVLPCDSSVRVWKNQMIKTLNIAKIAATFDGSKPMNHVIQWKKNNGLVDGVTYDATIQIDAAYINQQCCKNSNGTITNSMTNTNGKIVGIRYVFGFVLVLEKDVPALPLFLHFVEIMWSQIRALCFYTQNLANFTRVYQNMQLEQILASDTRCQMETNRVQTKHTNRVKITSQLEEEEIDRLYKLSEVVFEIMTKDNIENLDDKFKQVFEFWMEIKGSITTEWAVKKSKITPIQEMFERNGTKPDMFTRYRGDIKPNLETDQSKKNRSSKDYKLDKPRQQFNSQQFLKDCTPLPTDKMTFDWLPGMKLLIDQINEEEAISKSNEEMDDLSK